MAARTARAALLRWQHAAAARAEIEPRSEEGLGALGEREDGEEAEGADEHEQYEQVDPPG